MLWLVTDTWLQVATAAAGQMSSCAVIHDAASLNVGSVISTVTARTALTRPIAVCLPCLLCSLTVDQGCQLPGLFVFVEASRFTIPKLILRLYDSVTNAPDFCQQLNIVCKLVPGYLISSVSSRAPCV